jgi:hypothetical protein
MAEEDAKSPFFGQTYSEFEFSQTVYNYYIHPQWDEMGSKTLYLKLIYADYELAFAIIELIGEWNDAIENDIMTFKREILEKLMDEGIYKFIIIAENVFNFHGSIEDDYYAEWFEEVEDGWITGINFAEFVEREWEKYHIDYYINFGGNLYLPQWRTLKPELIFLSINHIISHRLGAV